MVQYINPIRPEAAPVAHIDGYYRPILDNTNSRGLEKLAAALGNLRKPFNDISQNALQQQQNQLEMMKLEQNLELQQQENAFRLFKAERDFRAAELREKTRDANEFLSTLSETAAANYDAAKQRLEIGEPLFTTNVFSGTRAGKITMDGDELPDGVLNPDMRALLDGAGLETGIDVRLVDPREAMGNTTANIVLVDSSTGKPVPMDGSDPRASNYATVLQALGATDIRTSGGDVLSVGLEALQGDRPEWLVDATENADLRNNITEVTPTELLTYTRHENAILLAQAEAGLRERGFTPEQIEELTARMRMEAAAREEQARIDTVKAQQDADVELLRADAEGIATRLLADENILSDDQIVAGFESNDDQTNIMTIWTSLLQDAARAMGYDDRTISRALVPSEIVKDKYGYGELQKRYSAIVKDRDEERRFASLSVEMNKLLNTVDASLMTPQSLTDVFFNRAGAAGLSQDVALGDLVSLAEMLDVAASSDNALQANVLNAENARTMLDKIFQAGAFLGQDPALVNRVEQLIKSDDAGDRFARNMRAWERGLRGMSAGDIATAALELQDQFAPVIGRVDEDSRFAYDDALLTAVNDHNAAVGAQVSDPFAPVTSTQTKAAMIDGQFVLSTVTPGNEDDQITKKQQALLTNGLSAAIMEYDDNNPESAARLSQLLSVADQNGYSSGLLSAAYERLVGAELVQDEVGTAVKLMNLSKNPLVDFKGNLLMELVAAMPGDASVNLRTFGNVVSQITPDQIASVEQGLMAIPQGERRATALRLVADVVDDIQANPAKIDKIFEKLSKDSTMQNLFGLNARAQGLEQAQANVRLNLGTGMGNVEFRTTEATMDMIQAELGLPRQQVRELTALGGAFVSASLKDVGLDDMDGTALTVFQGIDSVSIARKDGAPLLALRTDARGNQLLNPASSTVMNFGPEAEATRRITAGDNTRGEKRDMFLLGAMDGQTFDIGNARGSIIATVTTADGQRVERQVRPSDFEAIETKGKDFFNGYGMVAYGLDADMFGPDVTSVSIRFTGGIGMSPPDSVDYDRISFSLTTLRQAKQNGQFLTQFKDAD
jgi:hypothetical protein